MLPDVTETALVTCVGVVVGLDEMVFNKRVYMCLYVLVCGPVKGEHIYFVEGKCSAVLWVCVSWCCDPLVVVIGCLDIHPHVAVSFNDEL